MNEPYTVVIPAFNAERTLAAAIESVLVQTAPPSAVIVVDDGSTDRTAAVAHAYAPRVTLIQQVNTGPGAATSRGLAAGKTTILATNDADDIWLPHKAATQLAWLAGHPGVDAVFGRVSIFPHDEPPRIGGTVQDNWCRTTMMIRRAATLNIGPIVDYRGYLGDMIDWLARAREFGLKLELIPEILAYRRLTPNSLSSKRNTRAYGYLDAAKAALDRRRSKQA